ncbi:MAG: hypothetical protein HY231_25480 [Acidobacteria bacterium]|nr:hypothetical protein [Acidobacteriota bacterium]
MNHDHIDQFDFIDRYLMGKLPEAESLDFEAHFIDCPQCITRLQTANHFRQGLRLVVTQPPLTGARPQPGRTFRHVPQRLLRQPMAWAVAAMLIVALIAGLIFGAYTRRLRAEVGQAERWSEQWQRRYEEAHQAAQAAANKQQETEAQHAAQVQQLAAKLKDEQAQRAKLATAIKQQMGVEGNVPIFVLTSVRGVDPKGSTAANAVALASSSAWFLLSVALEGERRFANYRLTVFAEPGRRIGKSRILTPDRNDALTLLLQANRFRPGHYSLRVEGINQDGNSESFGIYPFDIHKLH